MYDQLNSRSGLDKNLEIILKKKLLRIFSILVVLSIPVFTWAQPSAAICLASSFVGDKIASNGYVRVSGKINNLDINRLIQIVKEGRGRIVETLWDVESGPNILFLDGEKVFGILDYNKYGSAITLPNKTCLLIGPKGANIDVVSHELVHADIAQMLGYRKYLALPAWINEGIAMQVDMRKRYHSEILNDIDPRYVTMINGSEFYNTEVTDAVKNYAAARHVVRRWIEKNGVENILTIVQSGKVDNLQWQ